MLRRPDDVLKPSVVALHVVKVPRARERLQSSGVVALLVIIEGRKGLIYYLPSDELRKPYEEQSALVAYFDQTKVFNDLFTDTQLFRLVADKTFGHDYLKFALVHNGVKEPRLGVI